MSGGALGRIQRGLDRLHQALKELVGAEIGAFGATLKLPAGAERHSKVLLERVLDDLVEQHPRERIVFFWDELPFMLYNIRQRTGGRDATEVLDALRAARQRHHDRLRMVFAGSVGLDAIVAVLHHEGYGNDPINDMQRYDLGPLTPADAEAFARGCAWRPPTRAWRRTARRRCWQRRSSTCRTASAASRSVWGDSHTAPDRRAA